MKVCVTILTVLLTGCSFAPGISIDEKANITSSEQELAFDYKVKSLEDAVYAVDAGSDGTENSMEMVKSLIHQGPYEYLIGPGDVLLITVFDHPELTMPGGPNTHPATSGTVVKHDGSIYFPYVGKIVAAGRNTDQVRKEITDKIGHYISNPQLDVRVVEYNSQKVQVAGAVNKPIVFPITQTPTNLLEAIQLAGGISEAGNERKVRFTRGEETYLIDLYELTQKGIPLNRLVLEADDAIYVEAISQDKVYVMGEVIKPQTLTINKYGLSLTEALGEAGGVNNISADPAGIYVIRQDADKQQITIYQLDGTKSYAFILGDKFKLQPRDVVYVSPSAVTRWNRVLTQLLPTTVFLRNAAETRN